MRDREMVERERVREWERDAGEVEEERHREIEGETVQERDAGCWAHGDGVGGAHTVVGVE